MITSSFLATAFTTAGFASSLTSFLRNASFAKTFVTSASEVTWFNSFLASFTSVVSFFSAWAFASAFFSSSFDATPATFDSVTVVVNASRVATAAFTSSCVASAFANVAFALANSSRAVFRTASSAAFAATNFCSNFSIADFNAVLSAVFTSAVSFFGVSSETLSATTFATSSLVVFLATGWATATESVGIFSLSPAFSVVVFSDTCSLACATDPIPKKMLAPITTDAAPTLNFLIE